MEIGHLVSINIASAEAARAHKRKKRKDQKTPYIVHPARVATLVEHFGGNHIAIIAAWLHDVFEDCSPEIILGVRKKISTLPLSPEEKNEINLITAALTKHQTLLKEYRMADSLNRILVSPKEATLIKICDRIDNLVEARDRDIRFIAKYREEAMVILEKLDERAKESGYEDAAETLKNLL